MGERALKPSQKQRILAALRSAGPYGITAVDFLRLPTLDGGPPITRVAARIDELRQEGLAISSSGTRDRCAVYVLQVSPAGDSGDQARRHAAPAPAAPGHAAGTLFNPAGLAKPLGAYDDIDEAA